MNITCTCKMVIAPQLTKCPRCGTRIVRNVKSVVQEDPEEATRRLDSTAKVLNAHKIRWVIPKAVQEFIRGKAADLKERIRRGDRMASRAEFVLARETAKQDRKDRWTWLHGSRGIILVSPKGNQYVKARATERADLILDYGNKDPGGWVNRIRVRLKRYERSSIAKAERKDAQVAKHHERSKREKKRARQQRKKLIKRLAK